MEQTPALSRVMKRCSVFETEGFVLQAECTAKEPEEAGNWGSKLMQKRVPTLQFFIVTYYYWCSFDLLILTEKSIDWWNLYSLRISGHTETEFIHQVFDGHVVNLKELQNISSLILKKGLISTINSLAVESPQHPPSLRNGAMLGNGLGIPVRQKLVCHCICSCSWCLLALPGIIWSLTDG